MYYFEILEGLYKSKVRYLIVGGLSVNLYGVPRVTQDIDIVIAMDRENVLKVTSLLKEFNGRTQDLSDIEMLNKVRKYLEEKNG